MMGSTHKLICRKSYTGVPREKPQGGGVFFQVFVARLAKIKTPPPGAFRKCIAKNLSLAIPVA